ncbi:CRAL/TRIO domain-containing protein [Myriangium duriaei CBS 260.36]|uniref:CRAL/TRIO domain-containing protein n=1 Tax=Myriangium duriaei CBS 260.36 TaxID=1168546 RepID=A0A9P4IY90_9PEZI|nr:CRAL/TRIO domain-containing protein [Myriangium duriaei CBS 260.36]
MLIPPPLQYPSQHIGFLEANHVRALEDFKDFAREKGYYRPGDGAQPASHDDETLLRYVRARRWNVQDAFTQFKDTEDWRKKNQIDKLYDRIDIGEYDVGRKLYPQWTGRRDKRGIPLYVFEVSTLTSKAVAAFENASHKPGEVESNLPPKMLRLFALYENLCNFALPLCSMVPNRPYTQTPVSQSSNIVDISGVSLRQFWNLKNHMQDASQLATAHYPETLDRIFIIGAPSFFPTVWGWIKRWFDPITVSKIFILQKSSTLSTLEEFVDRANIPKKYGGDLDYSFGDLPKVDPEIAASLKWIEPDHQKGHETFPIGPIRWTKLENGDMLATAVGSEDGKQRQRKVATFGNPAVISGQVSEHRPSTPPALQRFPSAVETHPATPPPGEVDLSEPPSGTPQQNTSDPSRLGVTSSIPYRQSPAMSNSNLSSTATAVADEHTTTAPAGTSDTVREGTSSTRFEQQSSTLGHGQLKHATPDTREDAYGDKHGVMEPGTVSQAPKEHPVPEPIPEQPGIVDQVKSAAGSAYNTASAAAASVAGAVGLGGTTAQPEQKEEPKQEIHDPAVDRADPELVEEFLRAQSASKEAKEGDAIRQAATGMGRR